jgi:hypothetical protein
MSETRILIRFYGCIFHETGNPAQLRQNFGISGGGWGFEHPKPPDTPLAVGKNFD